MFNITISGEAIEINDNFIIYLLNRKWVGRVIFNQSQVVEKWIIAIHHTDGVIYIDYPKVINFKLVDNNGKIITEMSSRFEYIYSKLFTFMNGN